MVMTLLFAFTLAAARHRPVAPGVVTGAVGVADDFRNGQSGWEAGFADYSPASSDMELEAGLRALPAELGAGTGFMTHGVNRSDDLFSFLLKKLTPAEGIRPNQRYDISFRIVMASNVGGSLCGGAGGSPAESVHLKAGATPQLPVVTLDSTNVYRISVDKGQQSVGGSEMSVAGDVSNGSDDCGGGAPFRTFERSVHHSTAIAANPAGEIWLIVGTDSGFEGRQTLYYQAISAALAPIH